MISIPGLVYPGKNKSLVFFSVKSDSMENLSDSVRMNTSVTTGEVWVRIGDPYQLKPASSKHVKHFKFLYWCW